MSAPRRPGDDRRPAGHAGRRPGKSDAQDGASSRSKRPTSPDDAPAKPARKVRAEGWAKAKPPREKPGRSSKFASKFVKGKAADRPTPMREDGPRRSDDDLRFAKPADQRADTGRRPARTAGERPGGKPMRGDGPHVPAGERPKRAFGDRGRAAAATRAPRRGDDEVDGNRAPRPTGARADGAVHGRADQPRPDRAPRGADRAPRGADRHARPAGANTLRPSYGAPRPVRDDDSRAARPTRAIGDRTTRPDRTPRDAERPVRQSRPVAAAPASTRRAAARSTASGKAPNRAARRAETREAAAPAVAPVVPAAAAPSPDAAAPFLPGSGTREPQRIAKLLARAGVASRREIERMIDERRIALNGVALETPATILTSLHGVTVDGQPVQAPTATRLFLFHKPPGVLTAERDFSGRPTIYDRLPEDLPRVMPVGRLDLNTEGLLLLTNDGEFKRKLELPSTAIPRVYRARAYGDVTQQMLEDLSDGVEIEGIRYGSIDANIERRTGANVWIEMRITEGKNREVRRVLEYLGLQVSRLIRTAYGEFVLADLASGGLVEVRQNDLVAFRQTLR